MKLELIKSSDSRLKMVCEEVVDFNHKQFYLNLIDQIKNLCVEQYAFATAAPQFGINKIYCNGQCDRKEGK